MTQNPRTRPDRFGVIATLIVAVLYIGLLIVGGIAPNVLSRSLAGGLFSVGMAAGLVVVLVIVGLAAFYVRYRDRADGGAR